MPRTLLPMALLLLGCGAGPATASPPPPAQEPATPPEAAPAPAATSRALALLTCAPDDGPATRFVVSTEPLTCDDVPSDGLMLLWHGGQLDWTFGSDRGTGLACEAPSVCDTDESHLIIFPGEPAHIEWYLVLPDEVTEHGSATVMPCPGAPPPCG